MRVLQGVLDNHPTESRFRLLVEPLGGEQSETAPSTVGFHSTVAHQASLGLHYPWVKLISIGEHFNFMT